MAETLDSTQARNVRRALGLDDAAVPAKGKLGAKRGSRVFVVILGEDETSDDFGVVVSRVVGRRLDKNLFKRLLAGVDVAVEATPSPVDPAPPLSSAEADVLDELGMTPATDATAQELLDRSRLELDLLLRESITPAEAAKRLGRTSGLIRQRLLARTLYGFKATPGDPKDSWVIPEFQFAGKRLLRGLNRVIPSLSPDAHPIAVKRWFVAPHQDLVAGEGEEPVSPIAWLEAGRDPRVVAALISEV